MRRAIMNPPGRGIGATNVAPIVSEAGKKNKRGGGTIRWRTLGETPGARRARIHRKHRRREGIALHFL